MAKHGISLTGNQLKIIALIAMTIDHVGMMLFPFDAWFRILGRLAFPVFAYMIGEGCAYTRSRGRYLGKMAALALVCQTVYFVFMGSLYQCVLVTFSLSVGLIFLVDNARGKSSPGSWALALLGFTAVCFLTEILPLLLPATDYAVDYGLWGVMLPLLVYFGAGKKQKHLHFLLGLVMIALSYGGLQWYSLLAVPLIFLYNGQRGKLRLKNLFYIYYPAHLVAIYAIGLVV